MSYHTQRRHQDRLARLLPTPQCVWERDKTGKLVVASKPRPNHGQARLLHNLDDHGGRGFSYPKDDKGRSHKELKQLRKKMKIARQKARKAARLDGMG